MKKLLFIYAMLLLPMIVRGTAVEINGIYYNLDSGSKTATVNKKSSKYFGNVVIPLTVSYMGATYNVNSIGWRAFSDCGGLISVTIPNSVTEIGGYAFENCSSLTSVIISNGVKKIECNAFENCSCLSTITIPNSVTTIENRAFFDCSSLTSITIPCSVSIIGFGVFSGCSSLSSIVVESSNTNYDSRDNCNAIIRKSDNALMYGCKNTIIPDDVTQIGNDAFWGCSGLISIAIPKSVKKIGESAFKGCVGLTSISIPNSVTDIGDYAFCSCSALNYLVIPNSVKNIGVSAFSWCGSLTSVTIPNSLVSIKGGTFEYCSGLTSIMIPNSVTSIGHGAFRMCSGLTSVIIPNSVTSIGGDAFSYCDGLTSVIIPNSVTDIDSYAFMGCSGLTSITIPNSLTAIGSGTFEDCSGLTSITIPNSVTDIGGSAFEGCSGLTSIEIPNTVTSIGMTAFDGCSGLTSITIPNSVVDIGNGAFYNNSALTDIFCYAESVPSVYKISGPRPFRVVLGALLSDYNNVTLHVPSGSIDAYASTAPWNEFKYIVPIEEDDLQDYLNSFDDTQDILSGSIYTRQFLNTEWQSLYVPFSLSYSDWSNNFEVARLDKFSQYDEDDDGEADRQELEVVIMRSSSDVLKANTPYLIRAKKTGTYNFTVNPSKLVAEQINSVTYSANGSKVVITGNYANQSGLKSAGRYRLMGGSLSLPSKDEEVLPPYRWYATIENSDKAKVRITFVDDATGIESINVDAEEMIGERRVYDLSGRRINISKDTPISSLPKGLYIINNKKYIVK